MGCRKEKKEIKKPRENAQFSKKKQISYLIFIDGNTNPSDI